MSGGAARGRRNPFEACREFFLGPVDAVRLDAFRVLTAACLLLYLGARWPYAREWLTDAGFHIKTGWYARQPAVFPLLPAAALPWFGALFFGSALALLIGWRRRTAAGLACGCLVYVTFADILMTFTINILFTVSLAVLALAPPAASPRPGSPARHSAWPVRILQATLILSYFGAGWYKAAHGSYWLHDPMVLWSHMQGVYRTDVAAWLLRVLPLGAWSWMQYTALTFELAAPLLFGIRRLRPAAYAWGIGFQLLVALTMYELAYFSLQMVSYYVLFADPGRLHAVRRAARQLSAHAGAPARPPA